MGRLPPWKQCRPPLRVLTVASDRTSGCDKHHGSCFFRPVLTRAAYSDERFTLRNGIQVIREHVPKSAPRIEGRCWPTFLAP
jgi:hypothetical protein